MEFQALGQKLDAALKSPVAVAEGPEHGGGVSALRLPMCSVKRIFQAT